MINLIELDTDKKANSGFGKRASPTKGASTNHKGIDLLLESDVVPSVLGGTVKEVKYTNSGGNQISIEHADGSVATYMHLSTLPTLRVGEYVEEGTMIGSQGSTGISTGKHLHFQIEKDGEYIDPEKWFNDYGSISAAVSDRVDGMKSGAMGIVGHVIEFISILLVLVLAVVLFMKAFDIHIM